MPDWKSEIRIRLAGLKIETLRESDIVEELADHLEAVYEEALAAGATGEEARQAAIAELSDADSLAEQLGHLEGEVQQGPAGLKVGSRLQRNLRSAKQQVAQEPVGLGAYRRINLIADLWQDLRYGIRMLLKFPGVASVAVVATALGISANTTAFSIVDSLILRPFNFPFQDRLIVVWERNLEAGFIRGGVAPGNFTDWREQNRTCEQLIAIEQQYFDLSEDGQPERFPGYRVTAGFFDALGVQAAYGRTFVPEESEPDRAQVVVLRHGFWRLRFGGDPSLVGNTLTINGEAHTVIGVMPPEFDYPYGGGQMWTPLVIEKQMRNERRMHSLSVIGLLKPGISQPQAQADLEEIALLAQRHFPETNRGRSVSVRSLRDDAVRGVTTALPTMIGAALLVLLIACANVANLLLARASARRKEIAVRLALGASRWRLIRQLLAESVLLAGLGGGLGLLLSIWAIAALSRGIPEDFAQLIPGWNHFGMNWAVFAFTFIASGMTGLLFGLAPAWQAARMDFNEGLKDGGKSLGARPGHRLRDALVVAEVALSLLLVIGAALLIRSFAEQLRADLGIRPENVLALQVALPRDGYVAESQRRDFYAELLRRVESLPDVAEAGAINIVPISGMGTNSLAFQIIGQPAFPKGREPFVQHRVATPGYFKAIGTALRKGRSFTEQDDAQAIQVVLVNETVAKRFFTDREPVGERLKFGDGERETLEIIGVVADVKNDDLEEQADPTVYVPYAQQPSRMMNLIVHSQREPTVLAAAIRSEVGALDRNVPVSQIKTMDQMIDERISAKRMLTWTVGVFAAIALLLAGTGIYAVMSYVVAERTHDIGIRLALGAGERDILGMVVRRALKLTLIGVVIGLAGAFALTRALAFFLFGVTATDPLTFTSISVLLAGVALLACWIPARRATRVDPLVALRCE